MSDQSSDEALLTRLQSLLADHDPVPEAVVSAARASLGWINMDAQLARLVADSLDTDPALAGVRGGSSRLLTFEAGDLTVEVEVSETGDRLRVLGQLVPPQPATVRAEQPGREVRVTADRLGRFALADLTPGPTRFGLDRPGTTTSILTEWTVL